MATPFVAGGVALVAQYFAEGWYPGGQKGGGKGHVASGALLRAMVLNGAQRLTGGVRVRRNGTMERLELNRVVPNNEQVKPETETRNPDPETRNPKPEPRNPNPETRNPKP